MYLAVRTYIRGRAELWHAVEDFGIVTRRLAQEWIMQPLAGIYHTIRWGRHFSRSHRVRDVALFPESFSWTDGSGWCLLAACMR